MSFGEELLFFAVWLAWGLYWLAQAANVKDTARRESRPSIIGHMTPLAVAALLLGLPRLPLPLLGARCFPDAQYPVYAGLALNVVGLLGSVWARRHIGGNWSLTVTLKHEHELVTSGPYAHVRHPIYTALLLAVAGYALARGEWRGICAFALVHWALARKLRIEERWMEERFGAAYREYQRRVPALLPRCRWRHQP